MGSSDEAPAHAFSPRVSSKAARRAVERFAVDLDHAADEGEVRARLDEALSAAADLPERQVVDATLRTLADLALQGWSFDLEGGGVALRAPADLAEDHAARRAEVRRQEVLKRDEQLSKSSVRRFVQDMERRRLHEGTFVSVFSLFRDGRALAEQLRTAREAPPEERLAMLKEAVDPYLVFFTDQDRCPYTGLRLMDVWRYFRHTWANQYTSVPGRTMPFIVRDRAVETHPVVGIGALSSAAVQIRIRDEWIGWHPEVVLADLRNDPTPARGRWLREVADRGIEETFKQDLLEEVLTPAELSAPTPEAIARLRAHAAERRARHQANPDAAEHKATRPDAAVDWDEEARGHLFTSKRALQLAGLLEARRVLDEALSAAPTSAEVAALAEDRAGARVIQRLAKKAKGDRVGTAVADISVCGAVPPYGPLIGGKLVAMLAASPEVVAAYRRRYEGQVSHIASRMAGRPITRPADLAYLGTTSLYGRSSQYNRVRVPADRVGGPAAEELRFHDLGLSEAIGTSQFSDGTVRAFEGVLDQSEEGNRVNYIFGEGVSPKLRMVRAALGYLGFPLELLSHRRRRVVYGVPLVANLRDHLLGVEESPRYLFDMEGPEATAAVAGWWRERWLTRRVEADEVLDAVAAHTLTWPIIHGARVPLPPEEPRPQLSLFEDL